MSTVRSHLTVSLDGCVAGPNQSLDHPFGEGAEHLNDWLLALRTVREMFGEEGGDTGPSDDVFRERTANVGAHIMGRNMFGPGPGPWPEQPWNGWWGDNPPYHTPVYVLTNHPREPVPMEGGTTFYFVTDGIESALEQARATAGSQDIVVAGGANVVQQYLRAGLLDELEIHLVAQVLGAGERLFDGVDDVKLEQIRVVPGADVTHLKYRLVS